jgi:hypothetical protein
LRASGPDWSQFVVEHGEHRLVVQPVVLEPGAAERSFLLAID